MARNGEKAKERAERRDRRPRAVARHMRISPFKARAALDLIRGKAYGEAVGILTTLNKSSADPILRALKSAGANAANNIGLNPDNLFVAECRADQGPTQKRFIPKARGRAGRILKRTSHITIVLDEIDEGNAQGGND